MNKYLMIINEIITEEVVDEYRILRGEYDLTNHIDDGNRYKKSLKLVNTPLPQFNVRYRKDGQYHDYFLYDKKTDKCVGLFSIETLQTKFKALNPGVSVVTPHMALAPQAQRQGVSTQAYRTFLQGGPWVFATRGHYAGAAKLWDSLLGGGNIDMYVDFRTQKPATDRNDANVVRLLGPKDRFNLPK